MALNPIGTIGTPGGEAVFRDFVQVIENLKDKKKTLDEIVKKREEANALISEANEAAKAVVKDLDALAVDKKEFDAACTKRNNELAAREHAVAERERMATEKAGALERDRNSLTATETALADALRGVDEREKEAAQAKEAADRLSREAEQAKAAAQKKQDEYDDKLAKFRAITS